MFNCILQDDKWNCGHYNPFVLNGYSQFFEYYCCWLEATTSSICFTKIKQDLYH